MPNSINKTINQKYHDLFVTSDGMDVLADIMDRGKIFVALNDDKDIGRSDLAKEIMTMALTETSGTDSTGRGHCLLDGQRFKKLANYVLKRRR